MKNMKLITETWNRFVNEEVGGEIPVPSAWTVTRAGVPGIKQGDSGEGVVLIVYKIEGGNAFYSLYFPGAPKIRNPRNQETVWDSAYEALKNGGLDPEQVLDASAGFRGGAMNLPVDKLLDMVSPLK